MINSITAAHLHKKNGLIDVKSKEFIDVFDEAFSLSGELFQKTDFNKNTIRKDLWI